MLPVLRLPTLTHTRSGNAKYLYEISHDHPLWMNPGDVDILAFETGEIIRISTGVDGKRRALLAGPRRLRTVARVVGFGAPGSVLEGALVVFRRTLEAITGEPVPDRSIRSDWLDDPAFTSIVSTLPRWRRLGGLVWPTGDREPPGSRVIRRSEPPLPLRSLLRSLGGIDALSDRGLGSKASAGHNRPNRRRTGDMKRFSYMFVVVTAVALIASACGNDDDAGGDLNLVSSGTLTLCTDSPYPPMEFEEDGEFTGFDIELIRAIADELGLGLTVINSGFDPITSGLAMEAGDCDISAAAITITADREDNIDFSDPYFTADQSLLVSKAAGVSNLAGFSGRSLGVQTGTTGEVYAQENATGADILSYENPGDLFTALAAGEIDGVLQDIVPNAEQALNDDTVELVETFKTDEEYGFATKEDGAEDVLEAVNNALKTLRDNGTYDEIYGEWFLSG